MKVDNAEEAKLLDKDHEKVCMYILFSLIENWNV